MADRHPEHDAEQAYVLDARAALEASIEHVGTLLVSAKADRDNPDARALAANLTGRIQRLEDAGRQAACFARLDTDDDEIHYIGRHHIADADQNALVIDWRARAAEPFYRATSLNPMGLDRRRQFVLAGDTILDIYDTDLTDPTAAAGIPDPLLAEINRARTGSMREIVSTIQAEQDAIVRAPLERLLVVQGGPGTGKTAVGLHRAAYLLFEHRDYLSREGVLVVGPNRRFLEYIADVLPSLGERSSRQIVPSDLGDIELGVDDDLDIEQRRLTGDPRMALLIRAHLERGVSEPTEDVRVRTDLGSATISAERAAEHQRTVLGELDRIGPARETWMSRMIADMRSDLRSRAGAGGPTATASEFGRAVRRTDTFKDLVKRHWPAVKAQAVVKGLWRDAVRDAELMRSVGFDDAEADILMRRPPRRALSEVDRPLIDEAAFQLGQRFVEYGHVILDEAQDLSPMALRMVARRARGGSFTVLGDVAQCSGDWMYDSWDLPLASLSRTDAVVETAELTVGYRVPGEFITLANALLPDIAEHLSPTSSVRPALEPPSWRQVDPDELVAEVVADARRQRSRVTTVAVIAPDGPTRDALRDQLAGDDVDVLSPTAAKGLEFDSVIVVDPADMHDPHRSWRPLFVALTRAVQHLGLVGSASPPEPIVQLL